MVLAVSEFMYLKPPTGGGELIREAGDSTHLAHKEGGRCTREFGRCTYEYGIMESLSLFFSGNNFRKSYTVWLLNRFLFRMRKVDVNYEI